MPTDRICEELDIPKTSSPADVIAFMERTGQDPFEGLLTSEDARTSGKAFVEKFGAYQTRVVRQLALTQRQYCEVQIDGVPTPALVALMDDCANALPTDMENLIFLAILQGSLILDDMWADGPGGRTLNWRGKTNGLAIIAELPPIQTEVARTIAATFGLEDGGLGVSNCPPSIINAASSIHIGPPTRCLSEVQGRLVFEAASVTNPKWRFLSLYRILENVYLKNVKDALLDDFDKDASKAVEDAKKKLSSEINQLVDLMRRQNLQVQFGKFSAEFEEQLNLNNRYISAIDRNAQTDPGYRDPDQSVKAVVRFYKIRCSIAHAGTSSVIYEQLPDADSAMISLLPTVEAIAHGSLNISIAHT